MSSRQLDEETIFHTARLIDNAEARDRYLEQICADDQPLRERVEALLVVHEQEQQFLKSTPDEVAPTVDQSPLTERPGSTIGRYRLMEQVGEGGMGVVFVAEQERPVRRKVALKIIKPGMDTKEVVARFEAERQALALMDHPNIAKVLDAGSTDSGRPYFVMEMVRGIPITEYCDQAKLSVRERLELFIQVCQAIQHAHQKGIIHRDVKPSNVLVTLHDGKPVPKVIDFGVAKATNQRLTERTIYTRLAQIIGTPMYMSPEQAELSGLDVDTRSDVYSLGVLLYELLTGATPFDKERFAKAAYDEIRRIVREEEPPKPSTKIGTLGETAASVSSHRNTEPRKLHQLVRGDLDWIVMKALEKNRARRYDTAAAFAQDVSAFIGNEPIEARPPSSCYRLRKFTQRNKGPVFSGCLILLAAFAGMTGTLTGWLNAVDREAKWKATLQEKAELLDSLRKELTEQALMHAMAGDIEATYATADTLEKVEDSRGQLHMIRGLAEFYAGQLANSRASLNSALVLESDNVSALALLGIIEGYDGDYFRSDEHRIKALNMRPRPEYRDYDEFFLAYLMMYYDPSEAVVRLERLLQRRPSPLVHTQLAAAITEAASYNMNSTNAARELARMAKAAEHVRIARQSAPENYFVTFIDFYVHCVTIGLHIAAGDVGWERVKSEADQLAEEVEETRSGTVGLALVAWYYGMLKDQGSVERVMRMICESGGSKLWLSCREYGLGQYHPAPVSFSGDDIPTLEQITGTLLSLDDQSRRVAVAATWEERLFVPLRDTRYVALVLHVPLLLGDRDRCRARCNEVLSKPLPEYIRNGIETRFIEPMLQHLADLLEDDELLSKAADQHEASKAHLQIAFKRLSLGERDLALKHLEASASVFAAWLPECMLARAYLERMKREPDWPSWIPLKQVHSP